MTRRAFLAGLAGVSAVALFGSGPARAVEAELDAEHRWALLEAVQQHLFPSEPDSPGAREIQALAGAYPRLSAPERRDHLPAPAAVRPDPGGPHDHRL